MMVWEKADVTPTAVMAGLVPAIHVFAASRGAVSWMPGTSPGMTEERWSSESDEVAVPCP
jgi:hypothetical protein